MSILPLLSLCLTRPSTQRSRNASDRSKLPQRLSAASDINCPCIIVTRIYIYVLQYCVFLFYDWRVMRQCIGIYIIYMQIHVFGSWHYHTGHCLTRVNYIAVSAVRVGTDWGSLECTLSSLSAAINSSSSATLGLTRKVTGVKS